MSKYLESKKGSIEELEQTLGLKEKLEALIKE